jgi:hypothetical protein
MANAKLITEKELKAQDAKELLVSAIELRKLAEEQGATIDDMNETIEELAAEKTEAKSDAVYITSNKKKYLVLAPKFRLDGQVYGVRDLKENAGLVEKVLKKNNQQILKSA